MAEHAEDNHELTALLGEIRSGLPGAPDRLFQRVYDELRAVASARVGPAAGVDPTTLVHESYLRLFGKTNPSWENRHHFFWAAARAMRDLLVERARRNGAVKRGGDRRREPFDEDLCAASEGVDLVSLNEALERLERTHGLAARVVFLRFFAGLARGQIAELLGLSPAAVWREWNFAKAWLLTEMGRRGAGPG